MDLLFKRYASPFSFMDGMIQTGRFLEFVIGLIGKANQEKEEQLDWEFFLHKVWEGSFSDFKNEINNNRKNQEMTEETVETTIKHSMNILNNFVPDQEGGEKEDGTI